MYDIYFLLEQFLFCEYAIELAGFPLKAAETKLQTLFSFVAGDFGQKP